MSALHVLFQVSDSLYALPATQVRFMDSFDGATALPNSPPFVLGVVQARGHVVPVIDLRARFGFPPVQRTLDTRIVIAEHGERLIGLVADAAREVASIDAEKI